MQQHSSGGIVTTFQEAGSVPLPERVTNATKLLPPSQCPIGENYMLGLEMTSSR